MNYYDKNCISVNLSIWVAYVKFSTKISLFVELKIDLNCNFLILYQEMTWNYVAVQLIVVSNLFVSVSSSSFSIFYRAILVYIAEQVLLVSSKYIRTAVSVSNDFVTHKYKVCLIDIVCARHTENVC